MADRYPDDRDRYDRSGEAWRERDERWRAGERDRPITERASDEVRSWFGDDEARRRRYLDEQRDDREKWMGRPEHMRESGDRYAAPPRDYGRDDLNRERDFGRSDRYANTDEGSRYGSRAWNETRPGGYGRGAEMYRGTSGYEADRTAAGRWRSSPDWEPGPFFGRGPRGYQRSDERIREEICERLTRHGRIDASDIDIRVANAEVTLEGSVDDRESKRLAEDVAESVFGVKDVNNQIKVHRSELQPVGTRGRSSLGETPRAGENTGSVLGLAGTANTPEMTPPDRGEPKKP